MGAKEVHPGSRRKTVRHNYQGYFFMQVTASIFKAYDIRGTYLRNLDEKLAEALGRAFGSLAMKEGRHTVAVGRDGRLSGPVLSAALMRGLVAVGIEVIDVGLTTTPQLYFAAHTVCDSGIQVTGSHNPKDDNGFKMVLGGRAVYGDEIKALQHVIENESWQLKAGGSIRVVDILPAYFERIVSGIKLSRPLKIVVDSGNGIAGATAPGIFRALGCEVIELFSEVDGHFPNHHPDPSKPENLKDLIATLQSSGAELGLAFDGDGDRLIVCDEKGNIVDGDHTMVICAADLMARKKLKKKTLVATVMSNMGLEVAMAKMGGKMLRTQVGDRYVVEEMRKRGVLMNAIGRHRNTLKMRPPLVIKKPEIDFKSIQNDLMNIGAEISIPNSEKNFLYQEKQFLHL